MTHILISLWLMHPEAHRMPLVKAVSMAFRPHKHGPDEWVRPRHHRVGDPGGRDAGGVQRYHMVDSLLPVRWGMMTEAATALKHCPSATDRELTAKQARLLAKIIPAKGY